MSMATEAVSIRAIADIGALDYYLHCAVETHCELIHSSLSDTAVDIQLVQTSTSKSVQFYSRMAHQMIFQLVESHSSLSRLSDELPIETKLRLYMAKYMGLLFSPLIDSYNHGLGKRRLTANSLLDSLHCLLNIKRGISSLSKTNLSKSSSDLDQLLDSLVVAHMRQIYLAVCFDDKGNGRSLLFKKRMLCIFTKTDDSVEKGLSAEEQQIFYDVTVAVRSFVEAWIQSSTTFAEKLALSLEKEPFTDSISNAGYVEQLRTLQQSLLAVFQQLLSIMIPPAAVILARKVLVKRTVISTESRVADPEFIMNSNDTPSTSANNTSTGANDIMVEADHSTSVIEIESDAVEMSPIQPATEVDENTNDHQSKENASETRSNCIENSSAKSSVDCTPNAKRIKTVQSNNMSVSNLVRAPEELKEFVAQHGCISPSLFRHHFFSNDEDLASVLEGTCQEIEEFVESVQSKDDRMQLSQSTTSNSDQVSRIQFSKSNRRRIPWSNEEVRNLEEGFREHGRQWAVILRNFQFHPSRDSVSLKDKARTLKL